MSYKKSEAHRSLELLEEYHAELNRPSDAELRLAIEKVISIFKTNLFQALCDIQDFYDNTLLNERVPLYQKTKETRDLAQRWENNPPFGHNIGRSTSHHLEDRLGSGGLGTTPLGGLGTTTNGVHDTTTTSSHSYSYQEQSRQLTKDGWLTSELSSKSIDGPAGLVTQTTTSTGLIDELGREWEIENVVLERNQTGLGFSISGGIDKPPDPDHYIRVTEIASGGAVARDGRIRKNDVIVSVNSVPCENVKHEIAVEALKNSGSVVRLQVKRLKSSAPRPPAHLSSSSFSNLGGTSTGFGHSPVSQPILLNSGSPGIQRLERTPGVYKLELYKEVDGGAQPKGLGFSIAGGIGNEHYPSDTGIYITRIIENSPAYFDGRLQRHDQLLAVDNVILQNVTHQFAVDTLKNTGNRVTLLYSKNPHPELDDSGSRRSQLEYPATLTNNPQEMDPRIVHLRKGDAGLGFNIVGGEDAEPIFISHVLPGGVSDLSGNVHKGDVLLRVNETNLVGATHNSAALALKACPPNSVVQLQLQYRPQEYQMFEEKVERLRNDLIQKNSAAASNATVGVPMQQQSQQATPRPDIYVRALFDNDPSRDTGTPHRALQFRYGDVLHVLNATDDDWWTARRVSEAGEEGQDGVIPSKKRVEKREKQRRKQVNFNAGSQSLGRNASLGGGLEGRRGSKSQLSFSRKFPFVKSTEKLNEFSDADRRAYYGYASTSYQSHTSDSEFMSGIQEDPIYTYEPVELTSINYVRPVIVLGALKDRINDELVTRQPTRFASCVPHTSRTARPNEEHGRDYYFVSKEEMERDVKNNLFIEAGQFQANLYGTSIEAVKQVAQSGRHCILDVSGNAIRRLRQTANIYPIALFIKPFSHHQLRDWDPQLNEDEAFKQFERCQRQEQTFGDLFTAVISGNTAEDVLNRVLLAINEQSRPRVWVPSSQKHFFY